MYVTRPLSLYRRDPSLLSLPPPGGQNSGILVIQDQEAEPTCCFGLCFSNRVKDLPFPHNKNLRVSYVTSNGQSSQEHINRVVFIPVLNEPLSSNLYYVIERRGNRKGKAYRNSKEEDQQTCCFCTCIPDLEPNALDPRDMYQQFEINKRRSGSYVAKSLVPGGFPPSFLRRKGWSVLTSTIHEFQLQEAAGLDENLRNRLPDFNFPPSQRSCAPVVVGKWYCPFIFITEGTLKDQINRFRYYEMTLEQRWEQFFAQENSFNEANSVTVEAVVETETAAVGGEVAEVDERNISDSAVVWYRRSGGGEGGGTVGLSMTIVERMRWEEQRMGWNNNGSEREVKVKKVEEYGGGWRRFGCYILVERFVLKRSDGSLVLTHEFKHTNLIRSKWE